MSTESKKLKDDNYITSSRAAQLSGYSQDYVGQLCRGESVECKRVSGEWHVRLDALLAYKQRFSPERVTMAGGSKSSDTLPGTEASHQESITDGDTVYLSSSDAAKRTGYSQDYIGQLARSGAVSAKKVGRKWFIEQSALEQHKQHNDGLLAAVQADSAGVKASVVAEILPKQTSAQSSHTIPIVTYKHDDGSLVPGSEDTATDDVPKPVAEVRSMPSPRGTAPLQRRDLRSRPIYSQSTAQHKAEDRERGAVGVLATSEIDSSQSSHMLSKSLFSFIVGISFMTIAGSLLIPETLHTYTIKSLDSIGITLDATLFESTTVGKETLQLLSSRIPYKKDI